MKCGASLSGHERAGFAIKPPSAMDHAVYRAESRAFARRLISLVVIRITHREFEDTRARALLHRGRSRQLNGKPPFPSHPKTGQITAQFRLSRAKTPGQLSAGPFFVLPSATLGRKLPITVICSTIHRCAFVNASIFCKKKGEKKETKRRERKKTRRT